MYSLGVQRDNKPVLSTCIFIEDVGDWDLYWIPRSKQTNSVNYQYDSLLLYSNTIMHFQERLISHGKERLKSYGCGKNAPYIAWYLQQTKTTYTIGIERTVK